MIKFTFKRKLGEGSYGIVYKIISEDQKYALKISKKRYSLEHEAEILKILNHPQIPVLLYQGIYDSKTYIVIPLYKISLIQIKHTTPNYFTEKIISFIGEQVLGILEYIHEQGYLYRDVKPENIMVGYDNKIYLIDYGVTAKFIHEGYHVSNGYSLNFVGTPRYASVRTHQRRIQSRRDDLESLGYVLLYLHKGTLPWCSAEEKDSYVLGSKRRKGTAVMGSIKRKTIIDELCKGLESEEEWTKYFRYVRELEFEERPDYFYLRGCLKGLGMDEGESVNMNGEENESECRENESECRKERESDYSQKKGEGDYSQRKSESDHSKRTRGTEKKIAEKKRIVKGGSKMRILFRRLFWCCIK